MRGQGYFGELVFNGAETFVPLPVIVQADSSTRPTLDAVGVRGQRAKVEVPNERYLII